MLKFDPTQLRTETVLISKVTGSAVLVRRHADGTAYEHPDAKHAKHMGRDVLRVPFNGGFAQDFLRQNYVTEFGRAKRACMLWYGDQLISVEVERGRKPDSEGPWVSNMEAALEELPNVLPKDQDIFYDGQYLFWLGGGDLIGEARLDQDGRFSLRPCMCVSMSNLGVKARPKKSKSKKKPRATMAQRQALEAYEDGTMPAKDANGNAVILRMRRSVLSFHPFALSPEKEKRDFVVNSPVLERNRSETRNQKRADPNGARTEPKFDDRRALYRMGRGESPVNGSLEFVMKAADVIGTIYGHRAVEFLDLPKIVAATGEVNLHRIDSEDRRSMPIQHRAEDCIAWLMGFIHKEKDLLNQRKLTSMFRYVLRHGLVEQVNIQSLRKEGFESAEIPMKNFRGGERLATPAPF